MIEGNIRERLSIEAVLSKISDYDIFRYYMPTKNWRINQVTFSPFRNEKHPSFLISNRYDRLRFHDFADSTKKGDCFTFVQTLFCIPKMDDVLKMIDRDFGLGIASSGPDVGRYKIITKEYVQPDASDKRYTLIQVSTRKLTKQELDYWAQYHQGEQDLKECNVYGIKNLYLNKKLFYLPPEEIKFGYYYDGHWKIYRPYQDKKNKWVPNNVPITAMDGKEDIQNCKIAFINKSKKDYMVMRKVFPCCCAVQNESAGCFSEENVEYLKANSDIQILSFDADEVGVKNSQLITKTYDFQYINVPRKYLSEGIKDWADLAKAHGLKTVEQCLKEKQIL